MKKILALICAFALVSTFCGCRETTTETSMYSYFDGEEISETNSNSTGDNSIGDNSTGSNSTGSNSTGNNSTGNNSVIDNPLDADLKGATITIYDTNKTFSPDAKSSKTMAAKAEVIKKIQKELNCKFVVKNVDASKLKTLVSTSAAGGKALCDIITVQVHGMGSYISGNLVADMGKVSSMDLSKDYMNSAGLLDATRFGNGRYAINGGTYGLAPCIYFNKRILKEIGYDDNYIYNLVDSGKWTFEEFRALAKKATKDTNGKPGMQDDDQWGVYVMDFSSGVVADALTQSNVNLISFDNGKLNNNMTDSNIIKVGNLLYDISNKDSIIGPGQGETAVKNFSSGNALMCYSTLSAVAYFTGMGDEYGLVPSPKVDSSKKYSACLDWNATGLMIPAGLSAKNQYNAGAVLQAYMYLMEGVNETNKNEYLNRYLCDDKSGDNMITIMNSLKVQPAQVYAQVNETILTGTYRVLWNYINNVTTSMAPAIESTKISTQKALDELNTKIKDK